MEGKILSGKKIAMIIAFKDFRDEEYFIPKEILEKAGAEVKVVSNKAGVARGAYGGEANVDYLIEDVKVDNFDAVVFVGGAGCLKNLDNENSYSLAKETVVKNKVLAAICVSPIILAKAGVLKRKKSAVWSSPLDKRPIEILKEYGAIYKPEGVVTDENIVTADGPDSAEEFGNALIEILRRN